MLAYLNELSIVPKYTSDEVITLLKSFGDTYKAMRACGVRDIKVLNDFFQIQLAPGYTFFDWIKDGRADKDLRTLMNSVLGTLPGIDEMLNQYQVERDRPFEFYVNQLKCYGLGLASKKIFDTVSISLDPVIWSVPSYVIEIRHLEEDDKGEVIEVVEYSDVSHVSTQAHVATLHPIVTGKIKATIDSGQYLWAKRIDLFPNLAFLTPVKGQIERYRGHEVAFAQILNRLFELQKVAMGLNGNAIKRTDFPSHTSPESATRETQFATQLTMTCPDGSQRLFSWHCRFTPGAGRIHFVAFEHQQKIVIGYVGQKIE